MHPRPIFVAKVEICGFGIKSNLSIVIMRQNNSVIISQCLTNTAFWPIISITGQSQNHLVCIDLIAKFIEIFFNPCLM
ncbi:hypothetical protein D3C81_876420 [compost metagenome]